MRCRSVLLMAGLLATAQTSAVPAQSRPAETQAAMDELWRRGVCLLSDVIEPARRQAALPKDLGPVPVLEPHVRTGKGAIQAYAVADGAIWAADDQTLFQVDATTAKVVRSFGPAEGFPEATVEAILPVGGTVWLAVRGGLVGLDVTSGRFQTAPDVRSDLWRGTCGPAGAWLVGDGGAWHLPTGGTAWRKLPDFPNQSNLAGMVQRGFWWAAWRERAEGFLPTVLSAPEGLCAVCLNRLIHFNLKEGKWTSAADQVWGAVPQGGSVWLLTTAGVARYDLVSGRLDRFAGATAGETAPAPGRCVAVAASDDAVYVLTEPAYDPKQTKFVGGGVSRFDLASSTWSVTQEVDGTDVRFATAVLADGGEAWVACRLYDRVLQSGAHPGMDHVKRWVPHVSGLGLLHYAGGKWSLLKREGLKTETRWILGQKGTANADRVGPDRVDRLCRAGDGLWGLYRAYPDRYYSGYYFTVGRLAAKASDAWRGEFDCRTAELGLAGEQPEVMLLSASHGPEIVLAEGHPAVLGVESVAGRPWVMGEHGLFAHDPAGDRFVPVLEEGFRAYWRVTAAAALKDGVLFGGDAGTLTWLDRKSGRMDLLGIVPDRRVVSIRAFSDDRAEVKTAPTKVRLPVGLRDARAFPAVDSLIFAAGEVQSGAAPGRTSAPAAPAFAIDEKANYLLKAGKRVAFLKGVFRPAVLCEDAAGGRLWLATYDGVTGVPLSALTANP